MKVKEIAEKYSIDEMDFDRFLLVKNLPCKKTFSGTDFQVPEYPPLLAKYLNA